MKTPLEQVMEQMDEEGQTVFQSNLMAGYSPRQALYNAFGLCINGDEVDTFPEGKYMVCHFYKDERLIELFLNTPDIIIEDTFWSILEV